MVKDTSVFSVIGVLEVIRVTMNIESTTYQPFVLYTVAAGIYVAVAFMIDFLFRAIERTLAKPATGRLSRMLTGRRRRHLELIAAGPGRARRPLLRRSVCWAVAIKRRRPPAAGSAYRGARGRATSGRQG